MTPKKSPRKPRRKRPDVFAQMKARAAAMTPEQRAVKVAQLTVCATQHLSVLDHDRARIRAAKKILRKALRQLRRLHRG